MTTPDELEILRKPEVQELISEKQGPIEGKDLLLCPKGKHVSGEYCCRTSGCQEESGQCYTGSFVRIPDLYSRDSERPERGLTGQINRFERLQKVTDNIWVCWVWDEWYHGLIEFKGDTPRLVLLRALEWQIERGKG